MSGATPWGSSPDVLDGDRRSVHATVNPVPKQSPARCRHGFRDRLDHQSFHCAVVRRHGGAGRGGDGRSRVQISAAPGVKMPEFDGTPIKLLDLATYTSGLPRMPSQFQTERQEQSLYRLHGRAALRFSVQSQVRLQAGHALRIRQSRLRPAGPCRSAARRHELRGACHLAHLRATRHGDTRITLTHSMQAARWRSGHDASLAPVPNWDFPALAGAGALRSTANDLLKFLQMCLDPGDTPLAAALEDDAWPSAVHGPIERDVALRLVRLLAVMTTKLLWKDGGTGGYATFIGYSTKTAAKPHPALQCGRLCRQYRAWARIW